MNAQIPLGFHLKYTLYEQTVPITRIAWSPNGQIIAVPLRNSAIHLCDATKGKLICVLEGHADIVYSVVWLSNETLASSSKDGSIYLWNVKTKSIIKKLQEHLGKVRCVSYSPGNKKLASGSSDQSIRIWDIKKGTSLHTNSQSFSTIRSLAWSPDGRSLVAGLKDGRILLLDTSATLINVFEGHSGRVLHLAWSHDGKIFASASEDTTIGIWNPQTGERVEIIEGHTGEVTHVEFSFDGKLLASKSRDNTVRIRNCKNWREVASLYEDVASHQEETTLPKVSQYRTCGLAFHPNKQTLATLGQGDTTVRVWNLNIRPVGK
jgi:WD40 repeat protein